MVGYGSLGELLSFEFSNPFEGQGLPPIPQPSLGDRAAAAEILSQGSEEHTSELQSHSDLVCRLLLEKKKTTKQNT